MNNLTLSTTVVHDLNDIQQDTTGTSASYHRYNVTHVHITFNTGCFFFSFSLCLTFFFLCGINLKGFRTPLLDPVICLFVTALCCCFCCKVKTI